MGEEVGSIWRQSAGQQERKNLVILSYPINVP